LTSSPPLPPEWPYAPRPAQGPLEHREDVALPGLSGLWRLTALPGLEFPGDPGTALTGAFGRGGVLRAGSLVLRPYRRGGLFRHLNPDCYAGCGRFQRELRIHQALWQAGLPTVEPLGFAHRPKGWGTEGVYLTRFQAGVPWPRVFDRTDLLPQVRALLEALSRWGLHAPDLNATNFLLPPEGPLLALDWDGARWRPGRDLTPLYRSRLTRSLVKLGAPRAVLDQF